ncbi:hypothetical protein G6F57_023365 [Rhizopus arrhizus]|nr:hypothetical protein G6F57_023365 [Rhizopus arrhizus]
MRCRPAWRWPSRPTAISRAASGLSWPGPALVRRVGCRQTSRSRPRCTATTAIRCRRLARGDGDRDGAVAARNEGARAGVTPRRPAGSACGNPRASPAGA